MDNMLELEDKSLIVMNKVYIVEYDWTLSKWFVAFDNGAAKYITEKDRDKVLGWFSKRYGID